MTSPKHLWSGDWRRESEAATADTAPTHRPVQTPAEDTTRVHPGPQHRPAEEPPSGRDGDGRRPRRGLLVTAAVVVAALLVGGAFAVGSILNDGGSDKASTEAALPAVSGKPIRPQQGQTREAAIYAKASPAVVSIRTSVGSGTGFLVDRQGTIVTNAHVVDEAKTVTVKFGSDGRSITGDVKGVDASSDLAVVKIDPSSIPAGTQPLALADSRTVRVGDEVIAIGNPFGLDRTETSGIISGTARNIQAPNGYTISEALQTDAAINPGNSGGPLLNGSAEVIGVNSQIETGGGGSNGNVGIGFAVSSNTVRQVVPGLKAGKKIEHPWLGVAISPTTGSGALISKVTPGGPAAAAGIVTGDVVTKIDGQAINDSSSLAQVVNGEPVGKEIKVELTRDGQSKTVTLKVGTRPQTSVSGSSSPSTPGTP